ncbi:Band 7 protein AAEL010189 [Araneus ventricosus]|uniref:Band 7 protein AAEL010189 n=1 Tax=Araneus ventricosus TaxID=182803 RepID=A0A4Y2MCL4_ARAVE|nr:Band 7 protein AAEL010189 [Araneus ventricosus]
MNAVSIPGSEELEVLSPSCIENVQVVQEYERAVIFRLGRLLHGGSKGPGIFFILPCIENYTKVDLRTLTFDVPPQEVIAAEGEQKASRALKEAAEVIAQSPAALQLRYLQTLNTISAEKNSTIIFPLPIDLLSHFLPSRLQAASD